MKSKTEIMIFGHTVFNKAENDIQCPWACYLHDRVNHLGVNFYSSLKFDKHCCSESFFFFYLRAIVKFKLFLSTSDLEKAVHAFIFSRLDLL